MQEPNPCVSASPDQGCSSALLYLTALQLRSPSGTTVSSALRDSITAKADWTPLNEETPVTEGRASN